MKSSKFFNRLQDIAKDDHKRKENKKAAKEHKDYTIHNNLPSKRYKM